MKLKIKLTIIFGLVMVMVIAVFSVLLLTRMRRIQIEMTREGMESRTGLYAMSLAAYYKEYLSAAQIMAQIQSDFENIDLEQRRRRFRHNLQALFEQNTSYTGVYSVWKPGVLDGMEGSYQNTPGSDEQGHFAPFYTRESGQNKLTTVPDHQKLLLDLSTKPYISDPEERTINGEPHFTVHFRAPVINSRGEPVGLVGIVVDLNYSQNLVDSFVPYGEGRAELYTTNGTIIAGHDRAVIGRRFQDVKADRIGTDGISLVENSLREQRPALLQKENLIFQSYPFPIGQAADSWALAASIPMRAVMREVNTTTFFSAIIALGAILFSIAASLAVSHQIAKPISGVSLNLRAISEGEGDLTKTISVKGTSEIGELAHYFNLTLGKIKELIIVIKRQSSILSEIGGDLSSNMTETAAAVNEITVNIQNIKARVLNQSASVTETNSTMEQISMNIDKLHEHVARQADSVAQSSSAIEQMIANIQSVTQTLVKNSGSIRELASASELGRTSLQEVAADISGIARESEGLQEINAVMENIAAQTNLLSMNAAIEAAHAGEAGRGFAVVADEIRKLAENSSEQSRTISEVLKKMKDAIDKITTSAGNVLDKFEAIDQGVKTVIDQEEQIRNAMEEQSLGGKQIMDAIAQLNEITLQVKSGSLEMREGRKEVILESKNLELVTQEISGGINEMAAGADEINSAVNAVNAISGRNKENIDVLVHEVSRFKLE
jgi:methyl-accepting chemotaxis protein